MDEVPLYPSAPNRRGKETGTELGPLRTNTANIRQSNLFARKGGRAGSLALSVALSLAPSLSLSLSRFLSLALFR